MTDTGKCSSAALDIRPARILIVDDEVVVRDVLVHKLMQQGHACDSCGSGDRALALLADHGCDLMLADIGRIEIGWPDFLREAERCSPDIAVILLASEGNLEVAVGALKGGAYDYIMKPFTLEEATFSVARALEKRRLLIENRGYQRTLELQVSSRTQQLKEALELLQHNYHSTLLALGTALDIREPDNEGHSLRVALFTLRIAREMGVPEEEHQVLERGALLHDIGKLGVPDGLLRDQGRLDEAGRVVMQRHSEIGYRILSGVPFLKGASELVLQHHERFDGRGYPAGLTGDSIKLGARIFTLADTLDGLTVGQAHEPGRSFEAARDEIRRLSGSQLDPRVVDAFLAIPSEEFEGLQKLVASRMRETTLRARPAGLERSGTCRTAVVTQSKGSLAAGEGPPGYE